MIWNGVMPAMTTAFDEKKERVDAGVHVAARDVRMIENGCTAQQLCWVRLVRLRR